jgi:hypothetical protein
VVVGFIFKFFADLLELGNVKAVTFAIFGASV